MKNLSFLIKPASSLCNLCCRYCFYTDIAANREQGSMGLMSQQTARLLLEEAFRTVEPGGAVSFAFQGGEPTLAGLDFFREFTRQAEELRPEGVRINFAIQTNGILLDREWAEFFRENRFLVGLSMDGYKDLHDFFRVDPQGRGTWNQVRRSLELLDRTGVEYNVLCVVTAQCAKHPQRVYRELKKLGVRYLQFIACLDPIDRRGEEPFSLTPELYAQFLCRLFDLWYADWESGDYHSVRLFDDYMNLLLRGRAGTCATNGQCGAYFVVEGDGSVYPCDFFALDQWRLGRLGENSLWEMAQGRLMADFLSRGGKKPPECAQCPWQRLCGGGCRNDWTAGETPHNYYCSAFQTFFTHAQGGLAHIAQAERQAMRG